MGPKKINTELKVGIFVLVGLAILILFVFFISDFRFIKKGYTIKAIFGFANGVKLNAPVRVAGVDMGEVKVLHIITKPKQNNKTVVEITIWLDEEAKVPSDSIILVNTLGLLGEKYIEIIPGTNYSRFLKDGDIILGEDPVSMHEVGKTVQDISLKLSEELKSIKEITDKIKSGEGTVGKLIYDDTIYNDLEALMADIKAHPWKLFWKSKETPKETPQEKR